MQHGTNVKVKMFLFLQIKLCLVTFEHGTPRTEYHLTKNHTNATAYSSRTSKNLLLL